MSGFRIPRKPKTEDGGAPAGGSGGPPQGSRPGPSGSGGPGGSRTPTFSTPGSSRGASNGKAFQPLGMCPVQTNNYKVTIFKHVTKFTRLSIETYLMGGKTEIKLSAGVVSLAGGINTTERRIALKTIFRKVFQRHPEIFGTDFLKYTYDAATTIYAVDGAFKGGEEKLEAELRKEHFTEEEWQSISRILRRPNSWFRIVLSANGVVWAGGPNAMSTENKQELCRVVETASSEGLNTLDFLHYNSQTFNILEEPVQRPDQTSEIRSGFDKAIRLAEGTGGVTDVVMAIDTKLSPFYAATSALKFMCGKYAEAKGYSSGGGGQQRGGRPGGYGGDRSGGHGGHRGYGGQRGEYQGQQDQRRRSRSRSPHRDTHQDDFNSQEAREVMDAFDRGNERQVFAKIESAMKGLFVEPIHLPKDKNRNVMITKLSPSNAENTTFKMKTDTDEEKEISVAEYFQQTYKKTLQFPRLPLVVTGRLRNEIFYPIEMLRVVPGQRIKNSKMSATVQGAMTGKGAPLPKAHVEKIQQILTTYLKIDSNPHLRTFGIQVSKEPIQMQATMLAPCQRVFGGSSKPGPMKSGTAGFDMRGTFFKPASVGNVAVIGFDGVRCDLNRFCSNLYAECKRSGLQMSTNHDSWIKMQMSSHNTEKLREEMEKLLKMKTTILIGITPEKKPDVHDVLKYYEAGLGLQTIQLHEKTANCFANDVQPQTKRNVMLKFNLKCGGFNFSVEAVQAFNSTVICSNVDFMNKKLLFGGVQFVGFEMTHGASRTLYDRSQGTFDGEPTIVGCGYSLKAPTELGGMNWLQPRNEYKLKDLETRFGSCLEHYQKATGSFPETVVIYRTGAGDGDYPRVQEEVEEMRSASKKVVGHRVPKIVAIVVQKSSHTRLFPKNIQGSSPSEQNVKSGTVVDSLITAPGRQEFFLVSQIAQIGTACPIKFSIVTNDCGWTKNEIMNLSYYLAFAHQVSSNPPALPHVLYAADNLAKRGRNNFLQHKRLGHLNDSIRQVLEARRDLAEEHKQEELDSVLVEDITNSMNAMAVKNKNFWA